MPHKLFEEEVGRTLQSLGRRCFYLKPLDGVMWAASRVDYHCTIDGRGVNIEAKEIKSSDKFNVSTQVTANQLLCLRDTEAAGGLGLLLVNFGRVRGGPGERSRGFMGIYRYGDLLDLDHVGALKHPLTPDDAFESASPLGGGLWQTDWLTRLLNGAVISIQDKEGFKRAMGTLSGVPSKQNPLGLYGDGGHLIRR